MRLLWRGILRRLRRRGWPGSNGSRRLASLREVPRGLARGGLICRGTPPVETCNCGMALHDSVEVVAAHAEAHR